MGHQRVLEAIAEFLSIKPFPTLSARLDHRGPLPSSALRSEDLAYLRDIFYQDVLEFAALSGLSVTDWPTINKDLTLEIV
jgi:hypothetical protein